MTKTSSFFPSYFILISANYQPSLPGPSLPGNFPTTHTSLHFPVNQVRVKLCQVLVRGELVLVERICFKPNLGNPRVPGRFSISDVQASKYQDLSESRLIPTVSEVVVEQNRDFLCVCVCTCCIQQGFLICFFLYFPYLFIFKSFILVN